jgi:hypothetical protein
VSCAVGAQYQVLYSYCSTSRLAHMKSTSLADINLRPKLKPAPEGSFFFYLCFEFASTGTITCAIYLGRESLQQCEHWYYILPVLCVSDASRCSNASNGTITCAQCLGRESLQLAALLESYHIWHFHS